MIWLALALLASATNGAPLNAPTRAIPMSQPPAAAAFTDENLVFFAMELDTLALSDSIAAYGDLADPYLPMSEIVRLLDLDVTVSPSERRVTGRLGEAGTSLIIDLDSGTAKRGGAAIAVASGDISVSKNEIYVRASALGRILPAAFVVDAEALTIKVVPTATLPVQARLLRLARSRSATQDPGSQDDMAELASPYGLATPPAFDVVLDSGRTSQTGRFARRFDVRAAGDLLYTGFQAFVGSDDNGRPTQARLLLERRSLKGDLLGPLRATRVSGGDVFTPSLALGPRSVSGRGISFTSTPLQQVSVFDTIDLRGELPIGFDVELYVNDVLRTTQTAPVRGRYEFLNIPLSTGINIVRVVAFGPRGQQSEQVRVINVGGGQLRRGQTTVDFGLVQQDLSTLSLQRFGEMPADAAKGDLRITGSVSHGLTRAVTLVAGVSTHTTLSEARRQVVTGGVRTSFAGLALRADAALDQQGGKAAGIGFAGRLRNVATVFEHFEYRGGFIDENQTLGGLNERLARHTNLTLDFSLPPIGGKAIPIMLRAERNAYSSGGGAFMAGARTSATFGTVLLSTGIDYSRRSIPQSVRDRQLTGFLAASTFIAYKWQLRGTIDYDLASQNRLRALAFTADRSIADRASVRLGIGHLFQAPATTNVQAGASFRLPWGEIAMSGDYALPDHKWSLGLHFAFGLAFDATRRSYRITPPGPAIGGTAAFRSFLDSNANGRFDHGEAPVANVGVEGGDRRMTTNAAGRAFLVGLGTAPTGRLQIGTDKIENFSVATPPRTIGFSPRPGKVMLIDYPLVPTGELLARVVFKRVGELVPLSAVYLQLVQGGRVKASATTEFDGTAIFNDVPAGTYLLQLEPAQASRLQMKLAGTSRVIVAADGGVTPDVDAEIIFIKATPLAEDTGGKDEGSMRQGNSGYHSVLGIGHAAPDAGAGANRSIDHRARARHRQRRVRGHWRHSVPHRGNQRCRHTPKRHGDACRNGH